MATNILALHDSYWRLCYVFAFGDGVYAEAYDKFDGETEPGLCRLLHERRGKAAPPYFSRHELIHQLRRLDHGLPYYWNSSVRELKEFVAARKLKRQESRLPNLPIERNAVDYEASKLPLVELLERADLAQQFDRLLELPPELRQRVYTYYFDLWKGQPLNAPTMPPLGRLSRQMRNEVLPEFFKQSRFEIQLIQGRQLPNDNQFPGKELIISPETAQFFTSVDETFSKHICNIQVTIRGRYYSNQRRRLVHFRQGVNGLPLPDDNMDLVGAIDIKLGLGSDDVAVSFKPDFPDITNKLAPPAANVEADVKSTVKDLVNSSNGRRKIDIEFVRELRKTIERTLSRNQDVVWP